MPKIESSDIKDLMAMLWLRHQAGLGRMPNNVFEVMLPPPTEEEIREAQDKRLMDPDTSLDERLKIAVYRLGGW